LIGALFYSELKTINFTERDELIKAAKPVLKAYFNGLGQSALYDAIQAIK
jgi:hypothetical protein